MPRNGGPRVGTSAAVLSRSGKLLRHQLYVETLEVPGVGVGGKREVRAFALRATARQPSPARRARGLPQPEHFKPQRGGQRRDCLRAC
jgi:hypothetical protein